MPSVLRIRELRERRKLTQEQLAYRAGVSLRTISRAEKNHGRPSAKNLRLIAKALGVKVDALFEEAA